MQLYNTLTRSVDMLKPLADKTVSFYSCGLTVYNQPHIGNWVGYIYWDVLTRVLEAEGYTVNRTQNYTDVGHLVSDDDSGEDKMEKGAKREGLTAWDVADKYIAIADHEAYDLLNLKRPTHLVRATSLIPEQIAFVQALEQKGYTYTIPDEGIYFDTSRLKDYGKLAQLDISGLEAGLRVSVEGKRNITDFALWKFSPKDQQRDMEWDSPWGKGFPGWHLECSVIAQQTLGDQIDLHAGGIDHIPVHHTNEIAQTEALSGKQFSQLWIHNNHLKVDGGKMAKSIGNIYTLQDLQDRGYTTEAFKILILSKHLRTEGNFTWDILDAAQNRLKHWQEVAVLRWQLPSAVNQKPGFEFDYYQQAILEHLANDLGTPEALAALDGFATLLEKDFTNQSPIDAKEFADFLTFVDDIFGLSLSKLQDISDEQKQLIAEREAARANKNWAESDKLRDQLQEQGIGLRDTPNGAIWYYL
jgi:cysteinyl-tRNA synthetase